MHSKYNLTKDELMKLLRYEAKTGHLYWISKGTAKTRVIGTRVGSLCKTSGYRLVGINKHVYREHHLVWLLFNDKFPDGVIDHINHDKADNRIENLRDISQSENTRNQSARRNTSSGEQGIWYCKTRQRWIAEIKLNGKKVFQSKFPDATSAMIAREAKLKELGFHDNHGSHNNG